MQTVVALIADQTVAEANNRVNESNNISNRCVNGVNQQIFIVHNSPFLLQYLSMPDYKFYLSHEFD